MAYVPTLWEDGITPVDAANMNKIEAELAALDAGGGGASLAYEGDYVPATEYQDGDTVVADGIVWLCVGGPTTTPPDPTLWGSLSPGGAGGGIPADVTLPISDFLIRNRALAGDAHPTFQLNADGRMYFGVGGATPLDASIYRLAGSPGYIQVDNSLLVKNEMYAGFGYPAAQQVMIGPVGSESAAGIWFGQDTSIYRPAAATLRTNAALYSTHPNAGFTYEPAAAGGLIVNSLVPGDIYGSRFFIDYNGYHRWGDGAVAHDVDLFRWYAGALRTQGLFHADGGITSFQYIASDKDLEANVNTANMVTVGYYYGGYGPGLSFGLDRDTTLYRAAALQLQTNAEMVSDKNFTAKNGGFFYWHAGAGSLLTSHKQGDSTPTFVVNEFGNHYWGPGGTAALDVNLYRAGVGVLKTDNAFAIAGRLMFRHDGAGGDIIFGGDTNLYRAAAGVLKTDGQIEVGAAGVKFADGLVQKKAASFQSGSFYGGAVATPVSFPIPFTSAPLVFVTPADALDNGHYISLTYPSPLTGFTLQVIGTALNASFAWIAVGQF